MTPPKPIQNELVLTDPDLSRLFLGQVPAATGFAPSLHLSTGNIDLSQEAKISNKTPLKDISKKWESHRIVKSHLEFIDKTIDYKNDFPKYLEELKDVFEDKGPNGVKARSYNGSENFLMLSIVLALKSSNPKDLQKYVAFIQQGIERASNAILAPESEIKLEDIVENTSRLTKMAGYALEVLKEPALQAQCFETLQKVYKNLESKLAQKPEYQFLLKYAKAQLIKIKLFLSANPSFQDVHDFKETIKAAKLALKENSPQKEFFTSLIEKDLDLFKNIQAPSAKDLSRIFISRQTGSFIISLASQIDLKAGDSQKQVENRVETLMKDLSTQFLEHPDYSFSKALEVLKTPESEHLKKLIQEKSVLRQLVECDKNIFLGKPDNSKPGNIISDWSDQVIKILEQHLSLSSQLTESEEVHRAAYQSILSQFSSKMGETHSPIAQSLFDFTREYPSNETSTSQKALQVSSQMTSTHFEIASGLSDFLSLKTAAFLVVTPLMSRALSGLILRRAGASGNLGKGFLTLVEEGELTKMGHLAVGGGVGMAFATSASLAQLKSDLGANRESPWKNFIRNMIVGSFVNGAALGFGAAGSAALKKAYSNPALLRSLESAPVTSKDKAIFFMNRLLPHAGGVAIGSASMLGANALARGVFHNWTGVSEKEKVPYITTAEVTETILTMLALNLVEMGTNRLLVGQATHTADRVDPLLKFSLGEYRTQEILKISNRLAKEKFGETVLHNPKDCHDRPDMGAALLKHKQSIQKENYRQALFNRMALSALDGLPLKDIATPRYALFLEQQIKSQTSPDSLPPSSETPVIPPMPTPVETVAVKASEREIPSGYTRVYLENGEGGQKRAKLAELLGLMQHDAQSGELVEPEHLQGIRIIREGSLYRILDGQKRVRITREVGSEAGVEHAMSAEHTVLGEIGEVVHIRVEENGPAFPLFLDNPEGFGSRLPSLKMEYRGREMDIRFRSTDPKIFLGRRSGGPFTDLEPWISRNHFDIEISEKDGRPVYMLVARGRQPLLVNQQQWLSKGQMMLLEPGARHGISTAAEVKADGQPVLDEPIFLNLPPIEVAFPDWNVSFVGKPKQAASTALVLRRVLLDDFIAAGFPEIKTPSSNPPTGEVVPVKDAIGRPFSIEPSTSITPTNDLDKLATARVTDISPTIEDVEIIAVTLERGVYAGQPETLIFKMTREKAQELGIRDVGQEFKVKFWLPPVTPPPPKVALESTPPPPLVEEDGEPTAKMRRNGLGADDATPLRELDTDEATPLREFLADEDMPPTVKSTRLNQLMALELKLKDLRTMLEANQALKTQADELTIVLKNDPKSIDIEYFSYVKGLKPHADDISVKLRFKDGKMVIVAEHLDSLPLETQQMIRKVLTE